MRGPLFKGFVVVVAIAVGGVPAASARSVARVELSVLPLPASSLGSGARSLPLQRDSGLLPNNGLVDKRFGVFGLPVTPNRSFAPIGTMPAKLGRISGYALDYGLGASGGGGVTEVRTGVDVYKTIADARKGLAYWQRNDREISQWVGNGLSVTIDKEREPAVGGGRFALFVSYRDANIAPLFGLDEQFAEGNFEADVTVWAGTATAAQKLAPRLAKKLDARIKTAFAGRLHAKPVELPPTRKAGPPPGGPDLASVGLKTTDLSGQADYILYPRYVNQDAFALSEYLLEMAPAGPFFQLTQRIEWYRTANQASLTADVEAAQSGQYSLDLSSVGDGARGALYNVPEGASHPSAANLVFSSGRLEEFLQFTSVSPIQVSQLENIAKTVANHINNAGLGK